MKKKNDYNHRRNQRITREHSLDLSDHSSVKSFLLIKKPSEFGMIRWFEWSILSNHSSTSTQMVNFFGQHICGGEPNWLWQVSQGGRWDIDQGETDRKKNKRKIENQKKKLEKMKKKKWWWRRKWREVQCFHCHQNPKGREWNHVTSLLLLFFSSEEEVKEAMEKEKEKEKEEKNCAPSHP